MLVEVVGLPDLCAFDLDSKGGKLVGTWCLPSCHHCSGHAQIIICHQATGVAGREQVTDPGPVTGDLGHSIMTEMR